MKKLMLSTLAVALVGTVLFAKDHEVKMLNKGSDGVMAFEPAYVQADIGDTVTFVSVDKGHDAKSRVVPNGAQPFASKISQNLTYKLEKEGLYVYVCTPHQAMNMSGVIQVGKPTNLTEANAEVDKIEAKAAINKGRLKKAMASVK